MRIESKDRRCWSMRVAEQLEVGLFCSAYFGLGVFLLFSVNAKPLGAVICVMAPVAFGLIARRPRLCLVEGGLLVRNVRNELFIPRDDVQGVTVPLSGRMGGHLRIEVRDRRAPVDVTAVRYGLSELFRKSPPRASRVADAVREHLR